MKRSIVVLLALLWTGIAFAQPIVVPERFGAYGDGVHDDRAALQAAIDYASALGGGAIHLSAKKYYLSDYLVPRSGTIMIGAGQHNTGTQFIMNGGDFMHFPSGAVSYYIKLEGFSVYSPDNGIVLTDPVNSAVHVTIRNVEIDRKCAASGSRVVSIGGS